MEESSSSRNWKWHEDGVLPNKPCVQLMVPSVCPKGKGGGKSEVSLKVNEIFHFSN